MPPIQGGVKLLLVASCYGNRAKFRPDEPLGFTFFSKYANREETHLISLRRIFIEIPQKNIKLRRICRVCCNFGAAADL